MHRADPNKRRKACDDWISTHEVVNSLPAIQLAPKLLKTEFPKDLEYRYCIEEVAESDAIELFVEDYQTVDKRASLPIDLFQPNNPTKKIKTSNTLPSEDQFLLSKYLGTKNNDNLNTLEARVFLNRRLNNSETNKPKSGPESRTMNKHFAPRKNDNVEIKQQMEPSENQDDTRHLYEVLECIRKKFSQVENVTLETLKHPSNPDLNPVAIFDLLPSKTEKVNSLLTLDADTASNTNKLKAPGQHGSLENAVFVKTDNLNDVCYSQYVPTTAEDDVNPNSCDSKYYEWKRNYEQLFSSEQNSKLALLILPRDEHPHKVIKVEQIFDRISLKKKRKIIQILISLNIPTFKQLSSGPESIPNRDSIKVIVNSSPVTK